MPNSPGCGKHYRGPFFQLQQALSVGLEEQGSWSGNSAQSWGAHEGSALSLG